MAFCPSCGVMYSAETKICPECKVQLKENQPEENDVFAKVDKEKFAEINWIRLQSTLNDIEADIITGLLETNGIPVMRKYPGMSGLTKVYMGSSFGAELYIPKEQLKEAQALLTEAQHEREDD